MKYKFEPATGVAAKDLHEDAITSLTFTPQCKLVSAGRDSSLRVWNLKEKGAYKDGNAIPHRKGNVHQLGVTNDGQWMLFDQGSTLKWYSVEKKNYVYTLNQPAGAMAFDTLAKFSPNGSLLLTGGAPGRMQLWRAPDEKSRGFEVRQFATTRGRAPSPPRRSRRTRAREAKIRSPFPPRDRRFTYGRFRRENEVNEHRVENVPLTLKTRTSTPARV